MGQCNHYGCRNAAEEGMRQCRKHSEYSREYQAERRTRLLNEGRCTRCGDQSRPGRTMCQECADKWNRYLKERRDAARA